MLALDLRQVFAEIGACFLIKINELCYATGLQAINEGDGRG